MLNRPISVIHPTSPGAEELGLLIQEDRRLGQGMGILQAQRAALFQQYTKTLDAERRNEIGNALERLEETFRQKARRSADVAVRIHQLAPAVLPLLPRFVV